MSTLSKRTKLIVGALLTVSLAGNFFFVGWLTGASPLVPERFMDPFGKVARLALKGPALGEFPERFIVGFLIRDLSDSGQKEIIEALDGRADDFRKLGMETAAVRAEIASLVLQARPDQSRIEERFKELERTMTRRFVLIADTLIPIVLKLEPSDRSRFIEKWSMGPQALPFPPLAPPPREN